MMLYSLGDEEDHRTDCWRELSLSQVFNLTENKQYLNSQKFLVNFSRTSLSHKIISWTAILQ